MSAHPSVLLRDFSKLVVLFALTGCTGPNPPPPPPATINVSGTVLLVGNAPLVGAEVFLEDSTGLRGPVTTAASGSFVFADVSTPYTLSVVPPAASELAPSSWANLRIPNPKVVLSIESGGEPQTNCAPITGRVAGFVNPPVGLTNTAQAFFISKALTEQAVAFAVDDRGPGAATYEILPLFDGTNCPTGALGTLVFVERDGAGDIAAVAVVDGVFVDNDDTVSTALNISPAPAQTATLSGTVTFPPGVDEADIAAVMKLDDAYAVMEGTTVSSSAPDFNLKVPLIAGVQYRVLVSKIQLGSNLRWAWSDVVAAPAADMTLALSEISALTSPSGPTADSSPTFMYSEASSTNLYSVLVIDGNTFAHLAMSDQTTVTIPPLPGPAQLSGDLAWALAGISARDADSIDDLLDGRMIEGLYLSTYAMNEPDRVRSGFVNVNFLNFSVP